jgi:glycosyltransferase involved in cell wall biosynthesis
MALGMPALVSPVGVNLEIIKDSENGFICHTDVDWEKYIRMLRSSIEDIYGIKS